MNYPIRLLPQANYKEIECDLSSHFLIRVIKTKEINEIVNSETGLVKIEHIFSPRRHGSDLSTSLLGVFEISHIQIELTELGKTKYSHYCKPNDEISPPLHEQDYLINSNRHFWVVNIKDIMNAEVEYLDSSLPFKANCVIMHTPMKWNFWHFSIRWKTKDGFWNSLTPKEQEKLAKRLGTEVRAYISKYARIDEPNYVELEDDFYLNQDF